MCLKHGFLSRHARNKGTWFIPMISWATPGTKWVPHIYSPVSFCCPISSETLGSHGFRDTVGPWFPDVATLKPGQKRPDSNASGCCHSWKMWDLSKFLSRFQHLGHSNCHGPIFQQVRPPLAHWNLQIWRPSRPLPLPWQHHHPAVCSGDLRQRLAVWPQIHGKSMANPWSAWGFSSFYMLWCRAFENTV